MENKTNQQARQPNASAQDATSYEQDSARNQNASSRSSSGRQQDSSQSNMLNNITGGLNNVQIPQAVKDFGATCARSFNNLSTTQKVIGGAAIALGASYWAASSQGWIGQNRNGNRSKTSGTQHS